MGGALALQLRHVVKNVPYFADPRSALSDRADGEAFPGPAFEQKLKYLPDLAISALRILRRQHRAFVGLEFGGRKRAHVCAFTEGDDVG